MNMEEALTVIQKIKDAWAAFGQSMAGLHRHLRICFAAWERAMNSGLSGTGCRRKNTVCLFIGGFVQLLLATSLSP